MVPTALVSACSHVLPFAELITGVLLLAGVVAFRGPNRSSVDRLLAGRRFGGALAGKPPAAPNVR